MPAIATAHGEIRTFEHDHISAHLTCFDRRTQGSVTAADDENIGFLWNSYATSPKPVGTLWKGQALPVCTVLQFLNSAFRMRS